MSLWRGGGLGAGLLPKGQPGPAKEPGLGLFTTVATLCNCVMGVGILALPRAVANVGLVPGVSMLLVTALLSFTTLCLLAESVRVMKAQTYAVLVRDAIGPATSKVCAAAVAVNLFGACDGANVAMAANLDDVLVRNVDNLGARVDPAVLGYHVKAQKETTVEVAPKWPEDVGGSPYLYQGRVQLVEQVRYPKGFDANIVDVFNTNTLTFSAASLDRSFDLGWYYVEKTVEDRAAVQMEHLIGEMTAHLSTAFLQVRRSGPDTRFLPIKTPEDLEAAREEIADMYDGRAED